MARDHLGSLPLVVVALALALSLGCQAGGPGAEDATTGQTSDETSLGEAETSATPALDAPYGACAGELATTECRDAGPEAAQCIERDDPQGVPYSTCAVKCHDDADCPPVGAGNISPMCWGADEATLGSCQLHCNLGANSCAAGTICIEGDPPLCMWPGLIPGHPDAQSFCDTACGPCGSTLLLPWSGECVAECLIDLDDCAEPDLAQVFACTGGEACPVGGAVVANCLESISCIAGSEP